METSPGEIQRGGKVVIIIIIIIHISGAAGENEGGEDKAVQQARALEQAEAELFDVAPPLIGVPPQRAERGLLASGLQALVSSLPMARSLLDLVAPSGEWSEDGGVVSAGVGSTSSAGE